MSPQIAESAKSARRLTLMPDCMSQIIDNRHTDIQI